MGRLRNFVQPLHTATSRDYVGRMMDLMVVESLATADINMTVVGSPVLKCSLTLTTSQAMPRY